MKKSESRSASQRPHTPRANAQEKLGLAFDYHQQGHFAQAEALYRDVLRDEPRQFHALHLLGLLYHQHGRNQEAVGLVERAVTIRPDYADAHNNLGVILRELKRYDEALTSYERALTMRPDHIDALNNRGTVLKELACNEEALVAYDRALNVNPVLADVHSNRGVVLQDLGRYDEALVAFAKAQSIDLNCAEAHWNEARCRLLLGDYAKGWRKYEWRWRRDGFTSARRNFAKPLWLGQEVLRGRSILLHAEQGLGDTIQFARYVSKVVELGANVILEVQSGLKKLLGKIKGAIVIGRGEALPEFDFHCPLLSLPLAFNTELNSIPSNLPELCVDADKMAYWHARLGPTQRLRVGLVWSGNAKQQDNARRSISLSSLMQLSSERVQWVSLQKEISPADRAVIASNTSFIVHFDEAHDDFTETAALMANVDLVISVCTSVAHLAGSMGKPLWVLLHNTHDWRWLLERDDSPWYPSAKLYRQLRAGDWSDALDHLGRDLAARASGAWSVEEATLIPGCPDG